MKIAYDLRMCCDFDPRSLNKFKEGKVHTGTQSPVYIFLIKKHWTFLIHKKFAYGLRLCHTSNFETKFGKFKDIGRKRSEFMQAVYIFFLEKPCKVLHYVRIAYDLIIRLCHFLDSGLVVLV